MTQKNRASTRWMLLSLTLLGGMLLGAAQSSASSPEPQISDESGLSCGQTGASCQGNSDCCSGYSCKDPMNGKPRACQPD